jgi:hypothetical protein
MRIMIPKLVLFIACLFFVTSSFCQIQLQGEGPSKVVIGKCKNGMYTQAELAYTLIETDTVYTLMYLNAKYTTLTDYVTLTFSEEGGTKNQLYGLFKSFFSDENKKNKEYKQSFKLGNEQVIASNYRALGVTSVMLYTSKGYCYLTESQIEKLFGMNQ